MNKEITYGKIFGMTFCILAAAGTVVLLFVNAYFSGQMKLIDKFYTAIERDDFEGYKECFHEDMSYITYEDFLFVKDSISVLQDNEKLHVKVEFVDRQKYRYNAYHVTFNLTIYNDEEYKVLENIRTFMMRDGGKWVIAD